MTEQQGVSKVMEWHGYVNSQNTRNPHASVPKAKFLDTGIIGPYFFKENVTGAVYLNMLKSFTHQV